MRAPILTLASNSPRRRQLLASVGWMFEILPANIDETPYSGEAPREYVLRMALSKAQACEARGSESKERVILAADTIVVDGEDILGKPAGPEEAEAVLKRLRGRNHQVYSAIALIAKGQVHTDLCISQVPMRCYLDEEIRDYVASGDPLDKAGAYAIQNEKFHPVEKFQGCFASVMGLPLCHLERTARRMGFFSPTNTAGACQRHLAYICPIHRQVLSGELAG